MLHLLLIVGVALRVFLVPMRRYSVRVHGCRISPLPFRVETTRAETGGHFQIDPVIVAYYLKYLDKHISTTA
jgi:hypothetical protein